MARSQSDTSDSSTDPTGAPVEPSEFAADREKEEIVLVLELYDKQAKDFEIPALAGRTVAECRTNSDYPDDDRVVEVVYVSSLNYRLREQKDMTWTRGQVLGMYEGDNLPRYNIQTYSVPVSRLREIDT